MGIRRVLDKHLMSVSQAWDEHRNKRRMSVGISVGRALEKHRTGIG